MDLYIMTKKLFQGTRNFDTSNFKIREVNLVKSTKFKTGLQKYFDPTEISSIRF